jgi:hypothetical protein
VDEKPIREIQPVVVPAQFYVWGPLLSGLVALLPGLLVGVSVLSFSEIPNAEDPLLPGVYQWGLTWAAGGAAFALTFVAVLILFGIHEFYGPGRTSYRIFPDRIEYCEGVWVRSRGTLRLDRVSDVELTEGLLQQTRGAGTVSLFTGHGEERKLLRHLGNVPRPKEVYDLLRSLAAQQGGPRQPGSASEGLPSSTPSPA